jgi:hypothetical protein
MPQKRPTFVDITPLNLKISEIISTHSDDSDTKSDFITQLRYIKTELEEYQLKTRILKSLKLRSRATTYENAQSTPYAVISSDLRKFIIDNSR